MAESKSKITFFGSADCDKDGNITSDMPAWYFPRHIEMMEESVNRKKAALGRGAYEADQVPRIKGEIEMEEKKLKEIKDSFPKLSGSDKDRCARAYENLTKQIRDTMPTRRDSKNGLTDPYRELQRLKTKHITISPEIAKACGVKAVQGKITGDEANKCYQILGRALGENTSVERIRKDGGQEVYHKMMDDLTKAILEGKSIK